MALAGPFGETLAYLGLQGAGGVRPSFKLT